MRQAPFGSGQAAGFSGAVDLAALAAQRANEAARAASGIAALTDATANDAVQESTRRPVFILLCSAAAPQCADLTTRVANLLSPQGDAVELMTLDVDVERDLAQVFQVQAVPAMIVLLQGRPIPLFQGSPDDSQLAQVFGQVLSVAAEAGMRVVGAEQADAPQEPPLTPLQEEAYAAIDRDDLEGALAIFDRALKDNPKDAEAKAGRAQVALMARTRLYDVAAVRSAAAGESATATDHLAAADLELLAGAVEDCFNRILDAIAGAVGPDRDAARVRLLELFEVVGTSDPRVSAARKRLASLLN